MKNTIEKKLKLLKDKTIRIIISNYIINIQNDNMEVETWSNSKQKKLYFTLNELDNNFSFKILNEELDKHINKLKKLEELGFITDDFISFTYKNGDNQIEFYDNKYYNVSTAMNDIIKIIELSKNNNKFDIISYEKIFKKHCLTKKFNIYDFYMMVKNEKSEYVQNILSFKDEFTKKYGNGIDIKSLEINNNVNILIDKKRISINLKDTDVIKHYNYTSRLTEGFIYDSIDKFKDMINKDVKLQQYMDFYQKNDFPKGSYIAKSYGYGVIHAYNFTFKEDVEKIKEILNQNGKKIKYSNEFSDAAWIYRFKVAAKDLNIDENKKIQQIRGII